MEVIISILITWGIVNICVQGSIFDPLKNILQTINFTWLLKLMNCPMCLGFWVGAIIGIWFGPVSSGYFYHIGDAFFNGCFYSGTTWLVWCFVNFLGNGYDPARTIQIQSDDLTINVKKDINIEEE